LVERWKGIGRGRQRASFDRRRAENCVICYTVSNAKEHTYSLTIERHEDGYLAYFPALPGCNTWGVTYEEAVDNAREALTVYLESLDELGRPFPKDETQEPVSLGLTVRMPIIA
jgi:antitoxin HicB